MPRPRKGRHVQCLPVTSAWRPAEAAAGTETIVLTIDEFEAIRLKDEQGMEQGACAAEMQVSRQTFQRILSSARLKLAAMLVAGSALRIEGGDYRLSPGRHRCPSCHREFVVSDAEVEAAHCPHCRRHADGCSPSGRGCGGGIA